MPFDAKKFAESTASGPMSTSIPQCPEGTWTAMIDGDGNIEDWFREVSWKDKKTGEARSAAAVRIPCIVTDQAVKDQLGREKVIVPYDIFLDVKSDGSLDNSEGKNVKLGQLREALGLNTGTFAWTQIRGAGPILVKTSQRSDPKDAKNKFAQVDYVAKVT